MCYELSCATPWSILINCHVPQHQYSCTLYCLTNVDSTVNHCKYSYIHTLMHSFLIHMPLYNNIPILMHLWMIHIPLYNTVPILMHIWLIYMSIYNNVPIMLHIWLIHMSMCNTVPTLLHILHMHISIYKNIHIGHCCPKPLPQRYLHPPAPWT